MDDFTDILIQAAMIVGTIFVFAVAFTALFWAAGLI